MEGIFNPITILLHIFNAVLLLLALNFLLYKPVRKYIKNRADQIEGQLQNARDTQAKADETVLAAEQKLKDADRQAQGAIALGAKQAQEQAQLILNSARSESREIVEQTKQEVDAMVTNAHESLTEEAATLAVEIASRMLGREVKMADHQQLVDDFVKKVG